MNIAELIITPIIWLIAIVLVELVWIFVYQKLIADKKVTNYLVTYEYCTLVLKNVGWEYACVLEELNRSGIDGWEYVTTLSTNQTCKVIILLKREIIKEK